VIMLYDSPAAAARILSRRSMQTLDDVPEVVLASIARVFGELLTPESAVARSDIGK
jgi:hypothetical protein